MCAGGLYVCQLHANHLEGGLLDGGGLPPPTHTHTGETCTADYSDSLMMRWHKWFMAVPVSVCSTWRPFTFTSSYSSRHRLRRWHGLNVFKYHSNLGFSSNAPLLNGSIWQLVMGEREEKVSLYTGQCGDKDWWVGYWFPARILWVVQSRRELIKTPFFLMKRIQNVPFLAAALNRQLRPHK